MKLISILDQLAATPATTAPAPRRALLAQLGRAAVAALPLGAAALPVAAAPADTSFDAVTQLLQLERTQVALYSQALAATGLIPVAQTADFQRLLVHQTQHAALLLKALQDAGALVPALPQFDFSGKHGVATNPELFPNVLTNFDAFLALAQQLEDLGVRLYQTQSINISDSQLLRAALRIHAVEAQHSAHIRGLRKDRGVVVQNWPSEEDATIVRPAAAQALTTAATGGEENGVQYVTPGVPIPFASLLLISTNTAIHDPALAEAFDEPVSSAVAQAALNLFV
ncbi:ferritin-like domain-containing protein [Hymenobacter ruber]